MERYFDRIVAWDANNFPYPWSQSQWRQLDFSKRYGLYICHSSDRDVVGYTLFDVQEAPESGHLLKIFVMSQNRREGLARLMLQKVIEEYNLRQVYLEVGVNNEAAIGFYKKLGFEVLTLKQKFYSDGESAYAMLLKCD